MAHQFTLQQMKTFCLQFTAVNSVQDLFELLMIDGRQYKMICNAIQYTSFKVKKRSGGIRLIEDPCDQLKIVQSCLNDFMQSVYYFHGPDSSHGFVASPDNNPRVRKSILTNAKAHASANYLVNMDLLDFFHYVTEHKVLEIFTSYPFYYTQDISELVSNLVIYRGRLPMGAPTSPVLSNFSMLSLDKNLLNFCKGHEISFTRFVDDLSFSSKNEIGKEIISELVKMIEDEGFPINKKKLKIFGPKDVKVVTGITIQEGNIGIDEHYLSQLEKELTHFSHINRVRMHYKMEDVTMVTKYKSALKGKLQFVKMVLGKGHEDYKKLLKIWTRGNQWKKEDYGYFNWLEYSY